MILIFYVDYCLMFNTSMDKIDDAYASLQTYFKIEDDRYLNKYLGIELYHCPYGSIYLRRPNITQKKTNPIPGIKESSANPDPAVKPTLTKN